MNRLFLLLFSTSTLFAFNRLDFDEILLGAPISEVVRRYGEPYAVYDLKDGTAQFEYLERVVMNNELIYENHYYLRVSNDKVISKCFREETQPPYDQLYQADPNYPTYP